jgi:peptidoglycan-associated lipoprotein
MKTHSALNCAAVLAVAAFLASCATSEPTAPAAQPSAPQVTPRPAPQAQPPVAQPVPQTAARVSPLNDPSNILSKRSVYYDYDNYDVKPEFRELVEAHARYLRDNPGARVTLEGNCDERGSREYNVALGQKRSEGVKKMMTLLGAREQQIEAVSFGEEKPKSNGHDESAWSQNRRSDIVYSRAQ